MVQDIKLIVYLFLLSSFSSFSQEPDSIKPRVFENFFGSDCPTDTLIQPIVKNDLCIVYSNEYKICRVKNGRVRWTVDLHEFGNVTPVCMIMRLSPQKIKKSRFVLIAVYLNFKEIGRKLIKISSGKVMVSTYKYSELE
jgi:hypothetical protein